MFFLDVTNGISRRNWARNEWAIFAIKRVMVTQPLLKVTIPNSVDENLFQPKFTIMKKFLLISFFSLLFSACSSVNVNSDFDKKVDFSQYKTYAFYKTGIDKVEISGLDKKRILYSIDETMNSRGFTRSETPDLLVNFLLRKGNKSM